MKNNQFQIVFASVLTLTLASGGAAFHLGSQATLSPVQNRLFDGANATWTMGTTTLIGLLTSQTSDRQDEDDSDKDDQ